MGGKELRLILKRFVSVFKSGGLTAVLRAVGRRILMPRARSFPVCRPFVQGLAGIEIGGPSPIFAGGGLVPVYPQAGRIDNCQFAPSTLWQGAVQEGQSFEFHPGKPRGTQFIAEGTDVHMVSSDTYDFVLSSHMLEHTANPLKALAEWKRLLKPGGVLILIVPHRDGTFDHRRPVTTLAHLTEDWERKMPEDDLTHLPEILELHDVARDPEAQDIPFADRAKQNARLRTLHHHVFDTKLAVDVVRKAAFELISVEPFRPYHILLVARRPVGPAPESGVSDSDVRRVLQKSPFPTDRP